MIEEAKRIHKAARTAKMKHIDQKADALTQTLQDLKKKLDERECHIRFVIRGSGRGRARFWTCDFTEDYIRINASYRT